MHRRTLLSGGCAVAGSLCGGCLEGRGGASVEPKERPERPGELTVASVLEFVEEYERVEVHNRNLGDGQATEIDVEVVAAHDRTVDVAFYVVTERLLHAEYRSGGTGHHGHGRTGPVTYRVTATEIRRSEVVDRRTATGDHDDALGIRYATFDDRDRTIRASVRSAIAEDDVGTETLSVPAGSALEVTGVAPIDEADRYRITASIESDPESTAEYVVDGADLSIDDDSLERSAEIGVYVAPDGTITVDSVPSLPVL